MRSRRTGTRVMAGRMPRGWRTPAMKRVITLILNQQCVTKRTQVTVAEDLWKTSYEIKAHRNVSDGRQDAQGLAHSGNEACVVAVGSGVMDVESTSVGIRGIAGDCASEVHK